MADLLELARKTEAVYHTTDFATRGMPAVRSDRCASCGATNDLHDVVGPTGNWLVLCARCQVKQLDEKLNRPSVTDLSAPTVPSSSSAAQGQAKAEGKMATSGASSCRGTRAAYAGQVRTNRRSVWDPPRQR